MNIQKMMNRKVLAVLPAIFLSASGMTLAAESGVKSGVKVDVKIDPRKDAALTKAAQEMMQASFKTRGQASVDRLKQDETQALCSQYQDNPPQAVRLTKRLLVEGRHSRLDTVLELSSAMQALAHATDDHREAANAFVEKRRPVFTGE